MPLRDHFTHEFRRRGGRWEAFHHFWPARIILALNRELPARYRADPDIHLGVSVAPDVTTWDRELSPAEAHRPSGNGTATAVWSPPGVTATLDVASPAQDEFEIRILDPDSGARVVAVIELVSPRNKDRPDHRDAFVGKCAAYLQQQVCLAVVDVITERSANLHAQLVRTLGGRPVAPAADGALYATVYRNTKTGDRWGLDVWAYELAVGAALPTLPLWLSADECVPVELEATYTDTGRDLRLW